jgi:hypothetical protein
MWGVSKGTKKAKEDVRLEKSMLKRRKKTLTFLARCEWVSKNIGLSLSEYKQADYRYKIDRLRWNIKILNRNIKPTELTGIIKMLQLGGSFIGVMGFVMTNSLFFGVFILFTLAPLVFHLYASSVIEDEDAKLERDFPDLFIILYSRLTQGSKVRLAPTLKDYLISLDVVGTGDTTNKAIKNFVLDLRNNIEIYGDDGMAVMKLRDKYTSVMIVNFSNLAVQALNGVDNKDKLLAFKIELNHKRIEQMKARADKIVARGSKAIWFVYIILFQFIVLSWIAKLTQANGLGSLFGM